MCRILNYLLSLLFLLIIMLFLFFTVLSRIRVSFVNTIVRMEHIPNEATSGVGVELHIDRYVHA